MSSNSLFSESTIETIKKVKKGFLWTAVCILIGEVIVGAILILAQSFNEVIGKLMGTFALCAVMMFFGVNNFSRMEKGDRIIQSFALVSLIGILFGCCYRSCLFGELFLIRKKQACFIVIA